MRTIEESNQQAKEICSGSYRYLYGAKGQPYTSNLVNKLAAAYPDVYTNDLITLAMQDADKGYTAIDCSGFVCNVLGIPMAGSAQIRNAAKRLPVSAANAKPGMAIYKPGHIAYIGEGLKIYEAANTAKDMCVSEFAKRAGGFQELLIVKGSTLESEENNQIRPSNVCAEHPVQNDMASRVVPGSDVVYSTCYNSSTDPIEKAIPCNPWKQGVVSFIKAGVQNGYAISDRVGGVIRCWCNIGDFR